MFNVHNPNRDIALKALPESESEGENAKLKGFEFALLFMLEATLEPADCSIGAAIMALEIMIYEARRCQSSGPIFHEALQDRTAVQNNSLHSVVSGGLLGLAR